MAADQPRPPRLSDMVDLLSAFNTLTSVFGERQVSVLSADGRWRPATGLDDAALSYRGRRLDGSVEEFHAAVDALEADTVPKSYWMKVQASRARRQHTRRDRQQTGRRP